MRGWWVVGVVVAGCGDNPALPVDAAVPADAACARMLSASPTMLDLGLVGLYDSSLATLGVGNSGACATDALSLELDGRDADQFAITSSACTGQRVAVGSFCTVDVRFAPVSQGVKEAELRITGGGAPLVVPIVAAAGTARHWYLTGSPYNFPAIMVGEISGSRRFTVNNSTPFPADISRTWTGTSPSEFRIVGDTCSGATVPARGSCTIDVVFQPTSAGGKSAGLGVFASGHGAISAAMSGTALPVTSWEVSPVMFDFGAVPVAQITAAKRFSVLNTGSVPSSPSVSVSWEGPNPTAFGVAEDTCSFAMLPVGGFCHVDVFFQPSSASAASASLEIRDPVLGALSVPLSGVGLGPAGRGLSIQPAGHDFGTVRMVSRSLPVRFTVINGDLVATPGSTLAAIASGNQFTIIADDCTSTMIPAGGTCDVWVDYHPTNIGPITGTLRVTTAPLAFVEAGLGGYPISGGGNFGAMPMIIDFGSAAAAGARTQVTISNPTLVPYGPITTTLSGIHPAGYRIVNDTCEGTTLPAGAPLPTPPSCTLEIETACAAPGVTLHASLHVVGGGDLVIPIQGSVSSGCP